jgi:Bacterial Ig domain
MKTLSLYFFLCVLLSGCSKNSQSNKDTELPVITLDTPLNNQNFADGQTVTISGAITDNQYIAEVHIVVSDLATGDLRVHAHLYPASTAASFSQDFTVNTGVDYKVEIIVLDRSRNQAVSSVQITCN